MVGLPEITLAGILVTDPELPYDLRHAAVSTWLNAGVPPTQVAEWAGHSVAVLLQIYAKCLAGQEELARKRIEATLREV
jgi:integrase